MKKSVLLIICMIAVIAIAVTCAACNLASAPTENGGVADNAGVKQNDGAENVNGSNDESNEPISGENHSDTAVLGMAYLSITVNMTEAGTVSGDGIYQYNSEVDLCAQPNPGYRFSCWKYQNVPISDQSNYKYRMWDTNVRLEAVFSYDKFNCKIQTNNIDKGEITVANTQTVDESWAPSWYDERWTGLCEYKQELTVAAYTKSDARFLGWFDQDETLISTNAIYSFIMPSNDYVLTAKWNYFTITYNLDGGVQNEANPTWYSLETPNINLQAPTMAGETFCGWTYKNQPITIIDTQLAKNLVLDARWTTINRYIGTDTEVIIGNWVKKIGENAFANREDITSVVIPDSVTLIGNGAFSNCSALSNVSIGRNVISIGDRAFDKCVALNIISIPNKVQNIGSYAFNECSELAIVTFGNEMVDIGDYAFCLCEKLESIQIPDSVKNVGDGAFGGCEALQNVVFGQNIENIGKYAFGNCSQLRQRLELPTHLLSIGDKAFYNCSGIQIVNVPDSVEHIGDGAFEGCSSLAEILIPFVGGNKTFFELSPATVFGYIFGYGESGTAQQNWDETHSLYYHIPESLQYVTVRGGTIAYGAFHNCDMLASVTIQRCSAEIGVRAFSGCRNLKRISIPYGVTTLGEDAFSGCYSLASLTMPDSLTNIGKKEFSSCTSLASITGSAYNTSLVAKQCGSTSYEVEITSGTRIDANAYKNCTGLISITIPDSVTVIYGAAFSGCTSLEHITIPFVGLKAEQKAQEKNQFPFVSIFGTSSYMGSEATRQYYYATSTTSTSYDDYYIPTSLRSVTVTGGNILRGAFQGCKYLTSITISSRVTSIRSCAFFGCSGLTSITIPDSVISIEDYAFSGCNKLTTVAIPDSVTSIKSNAFSACSGLTSIYYTGDIAGWCTISGLSGLMTYGAVGKSLYIDGTKIEGDLVIPAAVTSIGSYAFSGCRGLTSVTIPDSVTSIGIMAFYGCSGLTDIHYQGSKAQWNAISKDLKWNQNTGNYTVHCTDGNIGK